LAVAIPAAAATLPHSAPPARSSFAPAYWRDRAADMGVTVIFTDDERNCGAGCWDPDTPLTIYVTPGMSPTATQQVVLHELGHVWLYKHPEFTGSECLADRLAYVWGASGPFSYCGPIVNRG
jgi:hypothetical protein